MNKKISLGLAISLIALAAAIAIASTYTIAINSFEARMSAITDRQTTYDLVTEIDGKVRQEYFGNISEQLLREGIANGFISGLDNENCHYFTAEQWELESNRQAGYDFGLGMSISRASDGNIQVNRVTSGSPAAKAGIKKGDVILYVNGTTVLSTGYDKAIGTINTSTDVTLKVSRNGNELSYTVTKSKFDIVSVESKTIGTIGLISIYQFNDKTPDQFNKTLNQLSQGGAEGLIIDLRSCSGGSYEKACDILDTLLPAGKLMMFTDRSGETKALYSSDAQATNLSMCVLINETTSGAAELFASAMFDYGKANLVGTATKGLFDVQEYLTLSDGSALCLTTGTWSTTSALAVQNGVIVPDFSVPLTGYQQENLFLMSTDEDPQIQTALELVSSAIEAEKEAQAAATATFASASDASSTSASTQPTSSTAASATTSTAAQAAN